MKIISRYVFRQTLSATLMVLGSLSGIVWVALALKQLKVVTANGQDALTLFQMTTLALPNLMGFIAPVALLIATIHVLNRLNGDSELIVVTASGGTVWTVARPLLALALVVAVGMSAVNHLSIPWSLRHLRDMIVEMRSDLLAQALQPGRFSDPEPNITVHIRDRAFNGELKGILFHDARKPEEIASILAEHGRLVEERGQVFLLLQDGQIVRQKAVVGPAEVIRFESYALDLESFQKKVDGPVVLKARERYLHELVRPAPDDAYAQRYSGQLRAELHERFASPLYPFAFVMLALAFVGQAQSTRSNRGQAIAAAFVTATVARLIGLALNNLVAIQAWAVPLLYAVPLLVIAGSAAAIHRNARPRPGHRIADRISLAIEDATAAIVRWWPWRRPPLPQAGE